MPMLSSLTRQWLLRFLAAQSFSLLLCNFSLAFGANQTSMAVSVIIAQTHFGQHRVLPTLSGQAERPKKATIFMKSHMTHELIMRMS